MYKILFILFCMCNISFANNNVNYIKIQKQAEIIRQDLIQQNLKIRKNENSLYKLNKELQKLNDKQTIFKEDLKSNYYNAIKLSAHVNAFSQSNKENIFLFPGKAKDALIANSILKSLAPKSKKIIDNLTTSLEQFKNNKDKISKKINKISDDLKIIKDEKKSLVKKINSLDALLSSNEIFNTQALINQKKLAFKSDIRNIQRNSINMAKYYSGIDGRNDKFLNTITNEKFNINRVSFPIIGEYDYSNIAEKSVTITTFNDAILSSPFNGKIIFAGKTKLFGNLIIIQHNSEYSSIISGISKIYVTINTWVKKHQPIGVVNSKKQIVYNIFKNNKPIKFKFKSE